MKASITSGASGIFGAVAESAFAAGIGFLVSGILLKALGYDPLRAFYYLFQGSLGSTSNISFTLAYSGPVILTGLTFAIGVRAGLFNIGAEGAVYVGAAAAVAAGLVVLPLGLGFLFMLVCASLAGAAWAMPAFLLKAYRGVNEVISTIMMNLIALQLVQFVILNYLLDPVRSDISARIPPGSRFPILIAPNLTAGIIFAILVCIGVYYFLWRTPAGYEVRAVGLNADAARFSGISPKKSMLYAFAIGGITAGLAGAVEVAGTFVPYAIYWSGLSNLVNYGFNGIGVALIGRNHPLAIVLAGVFFGALQAGASTVQAQLGVPFELVEVLEGIIIFAIAAPQLYRMVRRRI